MSKDEFDQLVDEIIPCALFHVIPTDIDIDTGARLDEVILINILKNNLDALSYKNLKWFTDTFLYSNE